MGISLREGIAADVELQMHGDRYPVSAGPILRSTGWRGGIWVRYVPPTGADDWLVELSDGIAGTGFLLFPSEDYSMPGGFGSGERQVSNEQNWTSYQFRVEPAVATNTLTMVNGGTRALFRVFETVALTGGGARTAGPIVYSLNDPLKISENGLLCNDGDAALLAATGGAETLVVGFCCVVPDARSDNRLGLDLKF
jgi:hypothetical protein